MELSPFDLTTAAMCSGNRPGPALGLDVTISKLPLRSELTNTRILNSRATLIILARTTAGSRSTVNDKMSKYLRHETAMRDYRPLHNRDRLPEAFELDIYRWH